MVEHIHPSSACGLVLGVPDSLVFAGAELCQSACYTHILVVVKILHASSIRLWDDYNTTSVQGSYLEGGMRLASVSTKLCIREHE